MRKTQMILLVGRETLNLLAGTKGMFVLAYHASVSATLSKQWDQCAVKPWSNTQTIQPLLKLSKGMYCQPQQCLRQQK
jgi:hypothetical protein